MEDEISEDHKSIIVAALDLLNEFGGPVAAFLYNELSKEEHSDAEAWIAAYFEPQQGTRH